MEEIHPLALFGLSVLGPLLSGEQLAHGELKPLVREQAARLYDIPGSRRAHISEKTIEAWLYAYRRDALEGWVPKPRTERGHSKIPAEVQAAIHRLLQAHDLSRPSGSASEPEEYRSFEAEHAGAIWYGEVMHAPALGALRRKLYLVSLMDEASPLITHSAFCLGATALEVEGVLKQALLKRGLSKKRVIDNGAAYRAKTLQGICARLGIPRVYCRPYAPEAKGCAA